MATVDLGSLAAGKSIDDSAGDVATAPRRARVSWMLFDWATQPHYTLVQTFLFAPYFANAIVQNSVCGTLIAEGSEKAACGQALWGYAASVAGLLIAIVEPVPRRGRRRSWRAQALDGRGSRSSFLRDLSTLWLGQPGIGL